MLVFSFHLFTRIINNIYIHIFPQSVNTEEALSFAGKRLQDLQGYEI